MLLLLAAAGYLVMWPLTHLRWSKTRTRQRLVAPPSAKRMRTRGAQAATRLSRRQVGGAKKPQHVVNAYVVRVAILVSC